MFALVCSRVPYLSRHCLHVFQDGSFALCAAFSAGTQQDTRPGQTIPKLCPPELIDSEPTRFGQARGDQWWETVA
jgi:hypothetical protein